VVAQLAQRVDAGQRVAPVGQDVGDLEILIFIL
jgi:hypothetical protein